MDNAIVKNAQDLCMLIRCVLAGETPNLEGVDLQAVYQLAKRHSLSAITFAAIENTSARESLDKAIFDAWRQDREMAVRKNIRLNVERDEILRQLEEMGCWYLLLKGCVIADLYPQIGMRQMSDNDILFDPSYRKQVQELFLHRGYECKTYGKSNHDVYLKEPIYNFEMHVALFDWNAPARIEVYYRDIEKRLLNSGSMEKKLSAEDFYIYLLAHGNKHFSGGGNGLRFLLDCYLYLEKHSLDRVYVSAELEKLGLVEFETLIHSLSHKLFGAAAPLTQEEHQVLLYCADSNTYGKAANRISNQLKRIQSDGKDKRFAKWVYFWHRFWPDQAWFRGNAPFFEKWWILKPAFILWRCVRGLFRNGTKIAKEIRIVSKISLEDNKKT